MVFSYVLVDCYFFDIFIMKMILFMGWVPQQVLVSVMIFFTVLCITHLAFGKNH